MVPDQRSRLRDVRAFPQLVAYLRDEMRWPIERSDFEDADDLFFEYTPDELGIDKNNAAKIQTIRRLRPLSVHQPWGIFFVKFEPKRLPVSALRRILSGVAVKKRASANPDDRAVWSADDLLFASNYGEGDNRQISFAHFASNEAKKDLPTLKVLGWDNRDTALRLDATAKSLTERLAWPEEPENEAAWREQWRSAFTLRHREVITESKKLAIELAKLAQAIRDRISSVLAIETEDGPVSKMMADVKKALIHDLDEDDFADMYAQTIAYGLLSARITNPSSGTADDLAAAMPVTNPFLKELMESFLKVGGRKSRVGSGGLDFDELGVSEVVELLNNTNMEEVVSDFGDLNPQEDPVIHFFEGFLQAYDKETRKDRGVYYTPRPVVSFIVRSVDELLRTEFGLEDGLADTTTWGEIAERIDDLEIPEGVSPDQDFVHILDPATGTGTFLVEVIDLTHKTMTEKWQAEGHRAKRIQQLWNDYVSKHLLPRLHGYELMMAPYAIAHMKIGIKLYETGYRFRSNERARVYLTNALEPAQDFSGTFAFAIPALAHEAESVNTIKRDQRFTVVIGNPPYSSAAGVISTPFLKQIMAPFMTGLGVEKERKKGVLQDDYMRFIALSHHVLTQTMAGIFGLITNNSYVDGTLHRAMRKSLLDASGRLQIVNLHGSSRAGIGVIDDENVFKIIQGVAVMIGTQQSPAGSKPCNTLYADLTGRRSSKYAELSGDMIEMAPLSPAPPYYLLRPLDDDLFSEYEAFISIKGAFGISSSGIETEKDHFAVDFEIAPLRQRLLQFCDRSNSPAETAARFGLKTTPNWDLTKSRKALAKEGLKEELFVRYLFRCFDWRYTYYSDLLITRSRRRVMRHMEQDNLALVCLRQVKGEPWAHALVTRDITNKFTLSSKSSNVSYHFPLMLEQDRRKPLGFLADPSERINLEQEVLTRFAKIVGSSGGNNLDWSEFARDVFDYKYALLYCPKYRLRYSEYLKLDFPRVPLPSKSDLFHNVTPLGKELVALHLMESAKLNESITMVIGSSDFQVEKVSYSDGTVWINKAKTQGFVDVPEEVWNFHIGGYQVCEKWLKDRQAKGGKNPRPGRVLTDEDIAHYQKIVVALSETIRIMGEIDEVIEEHGGWPGAFQSEPSKIQD